MKVFCLAALLLAVLTGSLLGQDIDASQQRLAKIETEASRAGGLSSKDAQAACPSTAISCPYSGGGTLTTSSCIHQYSSPSLNSYIDVYSVPASAGQTITATMTSTAFDTYMTLRDSSGNTVAFDERIGSDSVRVTYTVAATGTYTLVPEALWPIGSSLPHTGPYSLSVVGCNGGTRPPQSCGDSTTACLNSNRFKVSVSWSANGTNGAGQAVPISGDTSYFWFFNAANVELVVKVLDGSGINNHFWVFYGALSNVQYTITVYDTLTGHSRYYTNPSGQLASVADTEAF